MQAFPTYPVPLATAVVNTPFTATSTTATPFAAGGQTGVLSVILIADQNCYIRVGLSGVAVATAADFYVPAGVLMSFKTTRAGTHFRVIRATADGAVKHYVV